MGGYGYVARITNKPKPGAVEAAGEDLWQWLVAKLTELARDDFGEALAEYAEYSVGTTRFRDSGVSISFGDGGGLGWCSCLATVHALAILAERHRDKVSTILLRHGLVASVPLSNDEEVVGFKFLWLDGAIAYIDGGILSRDSDGTDDGGEWVTDPEAVSQEFKRVPSLDELTPASRKRVRAFVDAKRCECPVCSTHDGRTGTKSTAKKTTAKRSTARKSAARKSTARKSAARKSTARKSTAKN